MLQWQSGIYLHSNEMYKCSSGTLMRDWNLQACKNVILRRAIDKKSFPSIFIYRAQHKLMYICVQ
jgi:hypothetical protein